MERSEFLAPLNIKHGYALYFQEMLLLPQYCFFDPVLLYYKIKSLRKEGSAMEKNIPEKFLPTHIVAAAGVVLNQKGEVLLVNTYQDSWVLPGGEVEAGENLIDAVKREIFEESGICVEVGELFCVSSNTGTYPGYGGVKEVPTKVIFDFICTEKSGTLRGSDENPESAWVPKEKVLDMIKAPSSQERFRAFLEYSARPAYLEYVTKPDFELKTKRNF